MYVDKWDTIQKHVFRDTHNKQVFTDWPKNIIMKLMRDQTSLDMSLKLASTFNTLLSRIVSNGSMYNLAWMIYMLIKTQGYLKYIKIIIYI